VQRGKEAKLLWTENLKHYTAFLDDDDHRDKHPRICCFGPPGVGKTKLSLEHVMLLRTYGCSDLTLTRRLAISPQFAGTWRSEHVRLTFSGTNADVTIKGVTSTWEVTSEPEGWIDLRCAKRQLVGIFEVRGGSLIIEFGTEGDEDDLPLRPIKLSTEKSDWQLHPSDDTRVTIQHTGVAQEQVACEEQEARACEAQAVLEEPDKTPLKIKTLGERLQQAKQFLQSFDNITQVIVSFANGTPFIQDKESSNARAMLAARVLYSFFRPSTIKWETFVATIYRKPQYDALTMDAAFAIIRQALGLTEDELMHVYLNVDEFNVLLAHDGSLISQIVGCSPPAKRKEMDESLADATVEGNSSNELQPKRRRLESKTAILDAELSSNELPSSELLGDESLASTEETEKKRKLLKEQSLFHGTVDAVSSMLLNKKEHLPKIFVMSLFSGTAISSMQAYGYSSSHPVVDVAAKLLTPNSRNKAVSRISQRREYTWLSTWQQDRVFMFCLMVTGGWGRPLEYVLEQSDEYLKTKFKGENPTTFDIDLSEVMRSVVKNLQYRYSAFLRQGSDVIQEVVRHVILGTIVKREQLLFPNSANTITYGYLEQIGLVCVDGATVGSLKMPFLWIYMLMVDLGIKLSHDFKEVWNTLIDPELVLRWQQWEDLVHGMLVLRSNVLSQIGKTSIKLSELLPAKGDAHFLDAAVSLVPLSMVSSDKQFPNTVDIEQVKGKRSAFAPGVKLVWWELGLAIKNAKCGPGYDIAFFLQEILTTVIFGMFIQARWRENDSINNSPLSAREIKDAYDKTVDEWQASIRKLEAELKTIRHQVQNKDKGSGQGDDAQQRLQRAESQLAIMKKVKVVLVAVTNRPSTDPVPENCLVICQSNLSGFFSPVMVELAAFAAETTCQRIVKINVDDSKDLQGLPGIGHQTAMKVLDARKQSPFKDLCDLIARVRPLKQYSQQLDACNQAGGIDWGQ